MSNNASTVSSAAFKPVGPQPLADRPMPGAPDGAKPQPSTCALLNAHTAAGLIATLLRKVTYKIAADGSLARTSKQHPIFTDYAMLPPLADERQGSFSTVPELRAAQSGTDFILRAVARSAAPVIDMLVGVKVGSFTYRVKVFGKRKSVYKNGALSFSSPEPFTEMPLRYEMAFGGRDLALFKAVCEQLEQKLGPTQWRRGAAFINDTLPSTVPVIYARNLLGLGYIADPHPHLLDGVDLPTIEREDDLLTPERFAQGQPKAWLNRPIPAGFDYFDFRMFPRTAMMGLPPLESSNNWALAPEAAKGMVPNDFCRGNIIAAEPADFNTIIHPDAGRCAAPALRLPRLRGNEVIRLVGMHADSRQRDIKLPAERPVFEVAGVGVVHSELFQVFIDTEAGECSLLWAASWPATKPFDENAEKQLMAQLVTKVERIEETAA